MNLACALLCCLGLSIGCAAQDVALEFHVRPLQHQFRLGEPIRFQLAITAPFDTDLVWLSDSASVHAIDYVDVPQATDRAVELVRDAVHPCWTGFGDGCAFSLVGPEFHIVGPVPQWHTVELYASERPTRPGLFTVTVDFRGPAETIYSRARGIHLSEQLKAKSKQSIQIEIIDDPAWADNQVAQFRRDFPKATPKQQSQMAKDLAYMDTSSSLAAAIEKFRNNLGRGDEQFSDIIRQTMHPEVAADLLRSRMLRQDFRLNLHSIDLATALYLRAKWQDELTASDKKKSPTRRLTEAATAYFRSTLFELVNQSEDSPERRKELREILTSLADEECQKHAVISRSEIRRALAKLR